MCSAIHPLVPGSPFFRSLELDLVPVHSPAVVAHPLDDGWAVVVRRSLDDTVAGLGEDGDAYRKLFTGPVEAWPRLENALLGPLLRAPRHPVSLARFAATALRSVTGVANGRFDGERGKGLLAGAGAHSFLPLDQTASASFALVLLLLAHVGGWPFPRGGSQAIADALAKKLQELGGEIETNHHVASLDELPPSRAVLCDVTPRQLLALAGNRVPRGYARRLRKWRYGPGAFKLDYALDGPVPWLAPELADGAPVLKC